LDVTVVMPAFNEAEILDASVGEVVERLRDRRLGFEVLVCENGSTDGTLEIAQTLAGKYPEVVVQHLLSPDYGAALHAGLERARGRIVVNFDVDHYDFGFLDLAVEQLDAPTGPAIVVGSKRTAGAHDDRPALRKVATASFAFLLRTLFRLGVSDTHGMKAMNRAQVEPVARACRFGKDLFDTELILRAERAGLRTAEIPVTVVERRPARTSIIRRVPRTLYGLGRLRVALWRDAS
jgi:glycosyltransferase involved in cell wall biosynthesis